MVNRDFRACARAYLFRLIFILADKADLVLSGVLHILFSLAYILSYPAIQALSPSLKIVRNIQAAMPRGLLREDLARILEADKPLNFCIDNLIEERLVWLKGVSWNYHYLGGWYPCFSGITAAGQEMDISWTYPVYPRGFYCFGCFEV